MALDVHPVNKLLLLCRGRVSLTRMAVAYLIARNLRQTAEISHDNA